MIYKKSDEAATGFSTIRSLGIDRGLRIRFHAPIGRKFASPRHCAAKTLFNCLKMIDQNAFEKTSLALAKIRSRGKAIAFALITGVASSDAKEQTGDR